MKHVGADNAHEIETFCNSSKQEEEMRKNHEDLFQKEHAFIKALRTSAKRRARLRGSLEDPISRMEGDSVIQAAFEDMYHAPHRWSSEEQSYRLIVMAWLGILENMAADSVSQTMTRSERDAATTSLRLYNNERSFMIGLYGDLQATAYSHIEKIQGDESDSALNWRLNAEFSELLSLAYLDAELVRKKTEYPHTLTQLMLRQLKQGIQFFYGDGEVLALGWEGEGAVVPEWAKSALRRFQKISSLLKQLLKIQMHNGLQSEMSMA